MVLFVFFLLFEMLILIFVEVVFKFCGFRYLCVYRVCFVMNFKPNWESGCYLSKC